MPTLIEPLFKFLERIGIVDVILPFLLVFALVYGVLEKTQPFGPQKSRIHSIIALVAGLIVVASGDTLFALNRLTAYLGIVIILGLLLMMLLGITGAQSITPSIPALIILGTLTLIGLLYALNKPKITDYLLPTVLIFITFAGLLWAVLRATGKTSTEEEKEKQPTKPAQQKIQPTQQEGQTQQEPEEDIEELPSEAEMEAEATPKEKELLQKISPFIQQAVQKASIGQQLTQQEQRAGRQKEKIIQTIINRIRNKK